MSVTILIDGVDRSDKLVRLERRDVYCEPGQTFTATFAGVFPVSTWEQVVIYEGGVKVFTGYTGRIEIGRPDHQMVVYGGDDVAKRLKEYFISEEHTSNGEGILYWIEKFVTMAGGTVQFEVGDDENPQVPAGAVMGIAPAFDVISELLLAGGLDIWCDEENILHVGHRLALPKIGQIVAGDNAITVKRLRSSEQCRNACIVYTPTGNVSYQQQFSWQIDENDIRKMVVASPFVSDPQGLAERMVEAAGPEWDVKTCEVSDVDPSLRVGHELDYNDGIENSGSGRVTTVMAIQDGQSGVRSMVVKLDERCPRIGSPPPDDGRDVIVATLECGVWRCRNIWASEPHWEPLNNGLFDLEIDGVSYGSAFNCEWFIRDPFNPDNKAYLLTEIGVLKTESLEPGQELWQPVLLNPYLPPLFGSGEPVPDIGRHWYVSRIRSSIIQKDTYFLLVRAYNSVSFPGHEVTIMADTTDGFATLDGTPFPGFFVPFPFTSYPTYYECQLMLPLYHSMTWGECNYGHQISTAVYNWHRLEGAGTYYANIGGFAAYQKKSLGVVSAASASSIAANAWPYVWVHLYGECGTEHGMMGRSECLNNASCLYPPVPDWVRYPVPSIDITHFPPGTGGEVRNRCSPAIHIPYAQEYSELGHPTKIWLYPGEWYDDRAVPTLVQGNIYYGAVTTRPIFLPWGDYYQDTPILQGAIQTYTNDATKVFCFSRGKPSRLAISEDEGVTWTEKESVPFVTSCYSGFPRSAQKIYAGRHGWRDPTADGHPPGDDHALIYVSWDRGETMHDVTGDLWEQTRALGKRHEFDSPPTNPLGTRGLVTIAPKY